MNVQTFVPGKFLAIQFPIAIIFSPTEYLSATIREFPR